VRPFKSSPAEIKVRLIGVAPVDLAKNEKLTAKLGPERSKRLPSTATYLSNLLKGESVYVVYDCQVAQADADKKSVAYLYRAPDGLAINQEVVRAGYAAVDTSYNFDQKDALVETQSSARKAGRGIYGLVQKLRARKAVAEKKKAEKVDK